jgi:hypothetical protein
MPFARLCVVSVRSRRERLKRKLSWNINAVVRMIVDELQEDGIALPAARVRLSYDNTAARPD